MESATCLAHLTPATVAMSREHTVFLMPAPGLAWQILRHLLSAIPGTVIVGEAETTAAALDAIPTLAPDLVLSSPVLGGESTMHALAALHRACPTTSVALFAADLAPPVLGQFIRAGVRGYLSWELDAATVRDAVATLLSGRLFVASAPLMEELCIQPHPAAAVPLSEREQRVLRHLAAGRTHAQIAASEHLSLRTLERGLAALSAKLGAPSPFVLGMRAAALGVQDGHDGSQPPRGWRQPARVATAVAVLRAAALTGTMILPDAPQQKDWKEQDHGSDNGSQEGTERAAARGAGRLRVAGA